MALLIPDYRYYKGKFGNAMNTNLMIHSRELKEFALETGLNSVRIASAKPLYSDAQKIIDCMDKGLIPAEYEWSYDDIYDFCNPNHFIPDARSVIISSLCYPTDELDHPSSPSIPCGLIAPYTRRNYYKETRKKLQKIVQFLRKNLPSAKFHISSCGLLREKPFAVRSGIGYYGKNGIVITPEWGSWVILGAIVTDVLISEDEPIDSSCKNCIRCMEACPTGAIVSPGIIDIERCLQYISTKELIPEKYREIWGNRLYGCVTCQKVCPKNQKVKPGNSKFSQREVGPSVPLIPLLSLSEEAFRERFRGNQIGARWVSVDAIKKNACVALGNTGDPQAINALESTIFEASDSVKEHAAWALKKIGGKRSRVILENALKHRACANIREKIKHYLEET